MSKQKLYIALLILNSAITMAAIGFIRLDFAGWHIGFFYGNKEYIDQDRLNRIKESVEQLNYTSIVVFSVTSAAWFALACFLLFRRRQLSA